MSAKPKQVRPAKRREPWAVPATAVACCDAVREHVAGGEIEKAVACALELSQRLGVRISVAMGAGGLAARIEALEATARRCPRLRAELAKEIGRLRRALDLVNGAAHRLCRRGLFSWPRRPGADVLGEIEQALKREAEGVPASEARR